jgi:hypothetical protein
MCDPNFTTLLQVKCNMAPREIQFHHPLPHLKLHKIDEHDKAFSGKSGSEVGEAQTFAESELYCRESNLAMYCLPQSQIIMYSLLMGVLLLCEKLKTFLAVRRASV